MILKKKATSHFLLTMCSSATLAPLPGYISVIHSNPQQTVSISQILRSLIIEFEKTRPSDITVLELSKRYNVQHRRLYDFFNFLTSLRICSYIERKVISWDGVDRATDYICNFYVELEVKSAKCSMTELFMLGSSPSLGAIGAKFLSLYLYLGVTTLSMRQAAKLFHDGKSDLKSLERRMYLVLSFLEMLKIISHSAKRSEYDLLIDANLIYRRTRPIIDQKMHTPFPLSIDSLLNKSVEANTSSLFKVRREHFHTVLES